MRARWIPVMLLAAMVSTGCRTTGVVVVRSLKLSGVHAVDASQLRAALATRREARLPLLNVRLPWGAPRPEFDQARLDADRRRVEAFYADRGYPNAHVTRTDVRFNKARDAVDITLDVDEGDPVRVASMTLDGFDMIPPAHLAALERGLPLHVGEPRDRRLVLSAHDRALDELRDHGYPYSKVAVAEHPEANGTETAVTLTADTGPLANFGAIEIAGNVSVSDAVIRRQLLYQPGELYRRSALQDTQRRLYSMGIFSFVNIEALNPEAREGDIRTRVTVVEGKHQRVNLGVGYGTEDKARADGEYHHVNFFGGARSAGVHGRWSSLDRGLRADINQPYFLRPSLSIGGQGQRWYTYTPAYRSIVTGGRIALNHQANARNRWSVSFSTERNTSSILLSPQDQPQLYQDLIALGLDPTTGSQQGTLSALGADWQRTTTDSDLDARRGYQVAVHVERAGRPLPGIFRYWSVAGDVRHFLPIGRRMVAANRLQFGDIRPAGYDPALVPFSKRYFLGGASSIRGWGRFEVSPLGSSGLPLGGNTMIAYSGEMRSRLSGKLGGVVFLDAGGVWTDARVVDLADIRYAVGAGLRYETPVGPIRLDFGRQLNPVPGLLVGGSPETRHWRVHFSIGQAF